LFIQTGPQTMAPQAKPITNLARLQINKGKWHKETW